MSTAITTTEPVDPITRHKRFNTLRAQAAFFFGASLWRVTDDHGNDRFVLTRGALTRELPSLDAVEALLDAAGAD